MVHLSLGWEGELNQDQNLIQGQTAVQSWTEFHSHFDLNCVGATQIMAELRSNLSFNLDQVWSMAVNFNHLKATLRMPFRLPACCNVDFCRLRVWPFMKIWISWLLALRMAV